MFLIWCEVHCTVKSYFYKLNSLGIFKLLLNTMAYSSFVNILRNLYFWTILLEVVYHRAMQYGIIFFYVPHTNVWFLYISYIFFMHFFILFLYYTIFFSASKSKTSKKSSEQLQTILDTSDKLFLFYVVLKFPSKILF